VADWRRKLSRSLQIREGPTLFTLADARAFILDLPAADQCRNSVQRAAEMILAAADAGDVGAATKQLELALFTAGKLKL
jgi:hypothetical protein